MEKKYNNNINNNQAEPKCWVAKAVVAAVAAATAQKYNTLLALLHVVNTLKPSLKYGKFKNHVANGAHQYNKQMHTHTQLIKARNGNSKHAPEPSWFNQHPNMFVWPRCLRSN